MAQCGCLKMCMHVHVHLFTCLPVSYGADEAIVSEMNGFHSA